MSVRRPSSVFKMIDHRFHGVAFVALLVLGSIACGANKGNTVLLDGGAGGKGGSGNSTGGVSGLSSIPGLESMRIEPAMATVTIQGGVAATQQFKAIGVFAGMKERDVTREVTWRTDNSLKANVDNDTKKGLVTTGTTVGGLVRVNAAAGLLQTDARLTIRMVATVPDSNLAAGSDPLPADPAATFDGAIADATHNPKLVYPADGVLLPPNLFGIEIHFIPASANDKLFEIAFRSDTLELRVFTRCQRPTDVAMGCIYAPDAKVWSLLAISNLGGIPVQVSVRGTPETGGMVGASDAIKMSFAQDDLLGGLYYWTTKPTAVIMRWDFGNKAQIVAERIIDEKLTGGTCPGCHALSRDGSKLVVSAGGQRDGRLLLFDLKTNMPMQPFPLMQKSQFESWNPDGSQFVGMYGDGKQKDLILFNGTTGKVDGTIDVGAMQADHPDWSADGKTIAFTNVGIHHTDQVSYKGAIAQVKREGQTWSAPSVLVPAVAGKNHFYPAISPTSDFLVFNQSTCPPGKEQDEGCDFDMDPSSKLWGMYLDQSVAPLELVNAGAPGVMDGTTTNITNSYPKWSPFVFSLNEDSKLMWMTFTSKRAYGLRGSKILIWMVGVVPSNLAAKKDPSFAAFALPFQDINTNNHIAQWTEKVVKVE
jgi:hypothetical protein